jgi:hypothetical protein
MAKTPLKRAIDKAKEGDNSELEILAGALFEISNDDGDHYVGEVPDRKVSLLHRIFKSHNIEVDNDEVRSRNPRELRKMKERDSETYRYRVRQVANENEDDEPEGWGWGTVVHNTLNFLMPIEDD